MTSDWTDLFDTDAELLSVSTGQAPYAREQEVPLATVKCRLMPLPDRTGRFQDRSSFKRSFEMYCDYIAGIVGNIRVRIAGRSFIAMNVEDPGGCHEVLRLTLEEQ